MDHSGLADYSGLARPALADSGSFEEEGIQVEMGRSLVMLGLVLVLVGLAVIALGRAGVPLGRLPGDLSYRGKGFQVFAPLGTSLLLSILLSLLLYVVARLRR